MKHIFSLLLVALTLPFFAACSEDTGSNPHLQDAASFVLNEPPFAANNVYDLKHAKYVELTTSQPAYGFPASTVYTVEVSLTGDSASFIALPTTHTSARMNVPASELNDAILKLAGSVTPTTALPVFIRLRANIYGNENLGKSLSNTIRLPQVLPYAPQVTATLPEKMYITGSFPAADNWSKWVMLNPAYGKAGYFYGVVYFSANAEFKVNPDNAWAGRDKGFGQLTIDDQTGSNLVSADAANEGANIKVSHAGWYTVVVETAVNGNKVDYTLHFLPAEVYLFGATNGGTWEWNNNFLFTVPATENGDFVSPVLSAAGEVRIAIKTTTDWWRTELTLLDGKTIFYRDADLPDGWNKDKGAAYSIQGKVGQQIHLNFTTGEGSVAN